MCERIPIDVKSVEKALREAGYSTFLLRQLPENIRPNHSMIQRLRHHGVVRKVKIADNGRSVWRLRNP